MIDPVLFSRSPVPVSLGPASAGWWWSNGCCLLCVSF